MIFDPSIYVSLAFLFGIAAQFRAMGGDLSLRGIVSALERRVGVVYAVVVIAAVASPFILNDVVVLVLTPVLIRYSKQFNADIAPLVVALICFTNIASALTPLGNPQNILLLEASGISFGQFVEGTWFRVGLSGILVAACLIPIRRMTIRPAEPPSDPVDPAPLAYLGIVGGIVFVLDLLGLPTTFALAAAFFAGFALTGRHPALVARKFDPRSLLTLYAFVASISVAALLLQAPLTPYVSPAAQGAQPYSALFVGGVSNVISNVPATQLLISTSGVHAAVAPQIAVEAALAGNIGPVGSFANILALLMVKRAGLPIKKVLLLQLVVGTISFIPAFI